MDFTARQREGSAMGVSPISRIRLGVLFALLVAGTPAVRGDEPAPIRFLREWGHRGKEPGEFHFPIGIAINAADEVFVTDFYNNRVQKFSTEGKLLAVLPVLPNPGGIAISRAGDLYLSH